MHPDQVENEVRNLLCQLVNLNTPCIFGILSVFYISLSRFVYVWDSVTQRILYRLPGHLGSVNDVDFHPKEPIGEHHSPARLNLLGLFAYIMCQGLFILLVTTRLCSNGCSGSRDCA